MSDDLNAPIWSFPPSWGEGPMVETYSFLTNLLVDKIRGTEQRQGMRRTPRRMLEGTYTVLSSERTELELAMQAVGDGRWRVPLWPQAVLTGELEQGDLSIDSDFRGRDVVNGTQLLVLGGSAHDYEVVTVGSLDAFGRAQLTTSLKRRWLTATVAPLRAGELTDQPQATRVNSYAMRVQARFRLVGANEHLPAAPTLVYQGLPVMLGRSADESNGVATSYQRFSYRVDGSTGGTYNMDTAGRGVYTQAHRLTVQGPYAYVRLLDLIYTLQGQLNLVWLPTFADDFTLAQGASVGDTTLVVAYAGYSFYGIGNPDRANLYIELCSGERMLFPILTAAAAGDKQTETLALGGSITTAFEPQDVYVCCFMALVRSASDDLEITSESGMDGLSTLEVAFRTEPDLRIGPTGTGSVALDAVPTLYVPVTDDTRTYNIGWSRVAGASSYVLEERIGAGGAWTEVQRNFSLTYTAQNRAPGTYYYRVSACDFAKCTAPSSVQMLTEVDPYMTVPRVPTGLSVVASGRLATSAMQVSAHWLSTVGVTYYELEQTHPQDGVSTVYLGPALSWTGSIIANGLVSYRVHACNTIGCSAWSPATSVAIYPPAGGGGPSNGTGGLILQA